MCYFLFMLNILICWSRVLIQNFFPEITFSLRCSMLVLSCIVVIFGSQKGSSLLFEWQYSGEEFCLHLLSDFKLCWRIFVCVEFDVGRGVGHHLPQKLLMAHRKPQRGWCLNNPIGYLLIEDHFHWTWISSLGFQSHPIGMSSIGIQIEAHNTF